MHKEFKVHMLNELGKEKARAIANAFDNCLSNILAVCPPANREISIVRTKLEEASFFAKKAMANDPINCHEEG